MIQGENHRKLLNAPGAACGNDTNPKVSQRSMWDYLRHYKSDHIVNILYP